MNLWARVYKNLPRWPLLLLLAGGVLGISITTFYWFTSKANSRPEIVTTTIYDSHENGRIVKGENLASGSDLSPAGSSVTFESQYIDTNSNTANAVVVDWVERDTNETEDTNSLGEVFVQVRTEEGGKWSQWVDVASHNEDRKDGSTTSGRHRVIVLASVVQRLQYRIKVDAGEDSAPVVELDKTQIEVIDASKGPKLQKKPFLEKLISAILSAPTASARADGPRIYRREEWGGWENPSIGWYPNSSPAWPEQYEPIHQVIIHHTASTVDGDSFAAMRALWHFHANGNGWGDIGYNYVVDPWGNTFKGRHYVEADAKAQGGEVVAGHTYEHNRGTSGISVIGNYTSTPPSQDALYSVARIAAFKMMPYRLNPADLSYLIGHRDATSTGCPGQQLYNLLPELRRLSNIYYSYYTNMDDLDVVYRGQDSYSVMWPNSTAPAYLDVKNEGTETWQNSGPNPIILATDKPRERMSAFCSTTWEDCAHIGSFSERVVQDEDGDITAVPTTTIQPGETARFKFNITALGTGGFYREHFALQSKNRAWFVRDLNIYYELQVPSPLYAWKMTDQLIYTDAARTNLINPTELEAGEVYYARIKAYNAGNQPWHRDGEFPTRLTTNAPLDRRSKLCHGSWIYIDCNRPAALKESVVEPMDIGTFDFQIQTPSSPTSFRENFTLMVERKQPIGGENQYWDVIVQ